MLPLLMASIAATIIRQHMVGDRSLDAWLPHTEYAAMNGVGWLQLAAVVG